MRPDLLTPILSPLPSTVREPGESLLFEDGVLTNDMYMGLH